MNKITPLRVINGILKIISDEFNDMHQNASISVNTKLIPKKIVQDEGDNGLRMARGHVGYFKSEYYDSRWVSPWKYNIILVRNHYLDFDPKQVKDIKSRWDEFLIGIGVPLNDMSNIVFTLLHEYGHVHMMEEFNKHGKIETLRTMHKHNMSAVMLAFDLEDVIGDRTVYSSLLFTEGYADNFAMKKFLPIWNKVKCLPK